MGTVLEQRLSLARAAGQAEMAGEVLGEMRAETTVRLVDESFSGALRDELAAMQDRLCKIRDDLFNLSHAPSPQIGYGDEVHRLANRGAEPRDVLADAEQLAAIEGRQAA